MRKYLLTAVLFICFVAFYASLSFGVTRGLPEGPVNIEADDISYDSDKELYHAHGNVIVTFTGGYLKADALIVNKRSHDAIAEGNVYIQSGNDVLEGERVEFNIDNKTGRIFDGTLFFEENHYILSGKEIIKKDDDTYFVKDAQATTCDGERPAWKLTARELDVTIDGYGTIRHGTFQVKNFPILYMPYMIFPAKTTRQSGLLFPNIGYSKDKTGVDIVLPFYWAISDSSDATFYQRYMSKRGFQEGVELRYYLSENSFGTFYADYLNDNMDINESAAAGVLARDWKGTEKRWSYYLNHETSFTSGFYLRTDIKKVSDNWYFKDFDSYNYYLEHYRQDDDRKFERVSFEGDKALASLESSARLVKNWEKFNLTGFVQYTDNLQSYSNNTTLQKYPEITFTGVKQPIYNTPFNFELESSYNYFYRTEGYRGHVIDAYPIFSLPVNWGYFFEFTPAIGLRETTWDASHSTEGVEGKHKSRELYDFSTTLSTEVHRIFNIGGQKLDKIKHSINPEVTYIYIPHVNQDDRPNFVAVVNEENKVTYALTNILTARLKDERGNISYREFMRFEISQAYDIKEARRELSEPDDHRRPFEPLYMELDISPFRYFMFEADAKFDINDGEWKQINADMSISDWRGDQISVDYRYTQQTVKEMNINLRAKITDDLDMLYVLKKNELDDRTVEASYGFEYRQQCWSVEVTYSEKQDDKVYMIVFNLYGLGEIGTQ